MSSSSLIRLGGLAAVVSGVLFVIAELLYLAVGMSPSAEDFTSGSAIVQGVLFVVAGMLLVGAARTVRGPEGRARRPGDGGVFHCLRRLGVRSRPFLDRRLRRAGDR